jgi:hypothetical protein
MKKPTFITLLVLVFTSFIGHSQTKNYSAESKTDFNSKPGLINITEVDAGIGLNKINVDYSRYELNLSSICGIGLARNLTGGIGIGVTFYNGGTLFPLFADFRYFFYIKKTRVFILGDTGVLLNSAKNVGETMVFVSPGVGLVLPISDNLSLSCSVGLFTQFREKNDHDSFGIIKNGMTYSFNNKKKKVS